MAHDWIALTPLADDPWLTDNTRALRDELNAEIADVMICRKSAEQALAAAAEKGIDDLDINDFDGRSLYRGACFTACRAERDLRRRVQDEYRPLWLADRRAACDKAQGVIATATAKLRAGLVKLGWEDTDDQGVSGALLPVFFLSNPELRRLKAIAHDLNVGAEPLVRNGNAIKSLQEHLERERAALVRS